MFGDFREVKHPLSMPGIEQFLSPACILFTITSLVVIFLVPICCHYRNEKVVTANICKTSQRLHLFWLLTLHEQNIHAGKEGSFTTTTKKKSQAIYVVD